MVARAKRVDTKYYKPRKIRADEQPRKTRAKNLEKARLQLMKDYEKLMKLMEKLEPEIEDHNQKLEDKVKKELPVASERARKEGRPFTWQERKEREEKQFFQYREPYSEAYYILLQRHIAALGPCQPDIDNVSRFTISPGGSVCLRGTCFGQPQGKVLLEITSDNVVELEVQEWSDTKVWAWLNSLIAQVPLRPYYGRIWLQTGNGMTSNEWPMMYEPIYSVYIATWVKRVFGGVFGKSVNGTFLKNRALGDPDFTIEWVERKHWGDGWSKKRSPYAGGQNMAQGWHIGVAAFGHANMRLLYRVKGPKGILPPYFSKLGPWGHLGDYW